MTVWENEESVEQWRNLEAHRLSQKAGRDDDLIDYQITVVKAFREYGMNDRENAPKDSNEYFKIITR